MEKAQVDFPCLSKQHLSSSTSIPHAQWPVIKCLLKTVRVVFSGGGGRLACVP